MSKATDALDLGRGTSFPLALEGALKPKEINYVHAEGDVAGALKLGSIALIDETIPVNRHRAIRQDFEKTVSNMQKVPARGGRIIFITGASAAIPPQWIASRRISCPKCLARSPYGLRRPRLAPPIIPPSLSTRMLASC